MSVLRVLAISHTIGLVLITVGAIVIADEFLLGDLAWGALAGIAGFIGLALLYRGLARGPMGVVAPLTAITSAAVPAGWGCSSMTNPWLGPPGLVSWLRCSQSVWRARAVRAVVGQPRRHPGGVACRRWLRPDVRGAGSDRRGLRALAGRGWSPDDRERDGRLLLHREARVAASSRSVRYPTSCRCRIRGHLLERAVSLRHPRRGSGDRRCALVALPDRHGDTRPTRARRAPHPSPAERIRRRDGRYDVDRV